MKLPNQASPVRRFVVQNYSGLQETLEEVASPRNSWELKLQKENDSSSPFKDIKKTFDIGAKSELEEVSSGGSSTQETPNPIPEPPDQIQEYPSDTGVWTKLGRILQHLAMPAISRPSDSSGRVV
ncbi:hypothetical protein BJP36_31745 [Moorena producens JHB]|uniref:Uncharacterized protein n=1 Tax=Moorena producens (strain JHB) TaxID=1454205 RepID=A0A1D9G8J0_MOOP1|nr:MULTISPECIES: hypothetical protein [Moorena]AOY83815.1 hypothetical protein BJP36_31745 [Moorena producens JHB]NEQ12138.1 hypothetical protein [Moorena sp. SIO4E2]